MPRLPDHLLESDLMTCLTCTSKVPDKKIICDSCFDSAPSYERELFLMHQGGRPYSFAIRNAKFTHARELLVRRILERRAEAASQLDLF